MKIRYCAPLLDHSGYAKGARSYFLSLMEQPNVSVIAAPVSFDKTPPNLGPIGDTIRSVVDKNAVHDVNIMHLTPEHYPIFRTQCDLNVGMTLWETTHIPEKWVKDINSSVDLVIVPCEWNRQVFKDCGVTKPIELVPYGFNPVEYQNTSKLEINGISENDYVFFSVFQWTQRKNYAGLIRAYFHAFYGVKDVVLLLKTYRSSTDEKETEIIVDTCRHLKKEFGGDINKVPRILLITDIISDEDIVRLNNTGDCYVSASRSEGWGLGMFNAMAAGKPAISPGGTANEVFMNAENSYLTKYQWTPVFDMPYIPWYDGRQLWLEPDLKDLSDTMRHVYNNREEAIAKGIIARQYLEENFNHSIVSQTLLGVLNKYLGGASDVAVHRSCYV